MVSPLPFLPPSIYFLLIPFTLKLPNKYKRISHQQNPLLKGIPDPNESPKTFLPIQMHEFSRDKINEENFCSCSLLEKMVLSRQRWRTPIFPWRRFTNFQAFLLQNGSKHLQKSSPFSPSKDSLRESSQCTAPMEYTFLRSHRCP